MVISTKNSVQGDSKGVAGQHLDSIDSSYNYNQSFEISTAGGELQQSGTNMTRVPSDVQIFGPVQSNTYEVIKEVGS